MATYYFINSLIGNDLNDGSSELPFKSFRPVLNNSIVIIQNIDSIVLSDKTNVMILSFGLLALPDKELPHCPLENCITYISLTNCVNVSISKFSVSASYFVPTTEKPKLLGKGITLKNCTRCVIQNCELFSRRDTTGWSSATWNANAAGILLTGGSTNCVFTNHIFNCGGIQLKSSGSVADGNLIENFPTDGLGVANYSCIVSNNIIRNSYLVNKNHNDMIQLGPGVQYINILNNIIDVFTDENQPYKNIACQGIGGFDGTKNIIIRGNTVTCAHPIGIWLLGTSKSIIENNIVQKCGSVWWQAARPSSISIQPSKSGSLSLSNTLRNNTATRFEIQPKSLVDQSNNYDSLLNKKIDFK